MEIEFEHQTNLAGGSVIYVNGYEVAMLMDRLNDVLTDDDAKQIKQAIKMILAAPDMYRDLIYLMSVLRAIPNEVLEQDEDVDFNRVMNTLRKAGYETTEWPLRQVPKEGGSEG